MASLSFSVWSLYKYRVQRSLEMRKFPWRECGGGVRVWFKSFVILHEWIPIITQISERFWAFGFKNFAQNTEYSVPYECDFIISYFNWVVVRLYLFLETGLRTHRLFHLIVIRTSMMTVWRWWSLWMSERECQD